jgi:hypothetical protein
LGGKAQIFKTSEDFLNSPDLQPYTKLEYLETEIRELKEEEEHLKWLKSLTLEEREWLIKQNIDELLKMNTRTQLQARDYIKRCYFDIRNNVESIDPEIVSIKSRYDTKNGGSNSNNNDNEAEEPRDRNKVSVEDILPTKGLSPP